MIARAPGKLMLAGEYAVLSGDRALVMAVNRYVTARPAGEALRETLPREVRATFERAMREGILQKTPIDMVFDASELRGEGGVKLGLGSSAAGAVAALALAAALESRSLSNAEIGRVAREGHRDSQGGGSGVDVVTSALGGVVSFERNREPWAQRVAWGEGIFWGVLWTGKSARTSEMLARLEAARGGEAGEGMRVCIREIGDCAREIERAGRSGEAMGVVQAVREHGRWMRELGSLGGFGIVTEEMEQLAARIEPFGAGMKPSGAGGGDVVLVVAKDVDALAAAMHQGTLLGFTAVSLSPDADGVRVIG